MKITDKRLLIIDKDGDIFSEDTTIGKQHQEILDDFAKSKHYDYSNIDYVTKMGMWYFIMLIITFLLHMHQKV